MGIGQDMRACRVAGCGVQAVSRAVVCRPCCGLWRAGRVAGCGVQAMVCRPTAHIDIVQRKHRCIFSVGSYVFGGAD